MNRIISVFLLCAFLLVACEQETRFRIEGKFAVADPTPMKLYELGEEKSRLVDSVNVTDPYFELSGEIKHPGIYELRFFNDQQIYLILFPGDDINLDIDNSLEYISYYVENSPESKRIKELIHRQNLVLRKIDQLSREWELHRTDTSMRRKIDSIYLAIMQEQKEFTRDFIYQQPRSLANIMAIYQNFGRKAQPLFDRYDQFELYRFVDSSLVAEYPQSAPVIALNREVNEIREQMEHKKYIKKVVEAGRPLPHLKTADIYGDTIVIDEPTKKPVLLMFWASWNPYSVEELLRLEKFSEQPASRKIRIITVSLDSNREVLMDFVEKNALSVPVICDYQYWDSEWVARYAVKQIPSTLLSNSQGLIIRKDIFGDELYNQIKDIIP